ncbi:hypothetical protein EDWATA_01126 [Edwardsiella tarda ATCC 23685]|uniref:Uncharacterized protein n=1 Tax=Edwardsiella tarda ATCC 23685 TaxID=500638 RepID=D4F324_EDWTA|nr:hypothetical protein EDWATA_01126 [Edwardsiella tarda ATCC 23685]
MGGYPLYPFVCLLFSASRVLRAEWVTFSDCAYSCYYGFMLR